jgi:hypothetical protein
LRSDDAGRRWMKHIEKEKEKGRMKRWREKNKKKKGENLNGRGPIAWGRNRAEALFQSQTPRRRERSIQGKCLMGKDVVLVSLPTCLFGRSLSRLRSFAWAEHRTLGLGVAAKACPVRIFPRNNDEKRDGQEGQEGQGVGWLMSAFYLFIFFFFCTVHF